ncbi:MAG: YkgJ family cysteine cluster protein [Kiritimatiellae bacterium]|nr:YkgJ family cysteine cluster protein [Kiritimatiellia bacterium]
METHAFACHRCGACCRAPGYVYLMQADVSRLAALLGLREEEFIGRYTELGPNRAQLRLADGAGNGCVFLEDTDCRVYAARPEQCRQFPLKWGGAGDCAGAKAGRA